MMLALGTLVGDGMRFQVRVAVADEDGSAAARQFPGDHQQVLGRHLGRVGHREVRRRIGADDDGMLVEGAFEGLAVGEAYLDECGCHGSSAEDGASSASGSSDQ